MDSRLDFDKFYTFSPDDFVVPMSVTPVNNYDIQTEDRKRLFCGDFSNTKPENFVQVRGKKVCDLMVAGAPSFYLVSERIIEALRQNGITGWGSYPVKIQTNSIGELNNYHAFYVYGKADKADRSLSEKIEVKTRIKTKEIRYKGYFFPLDSWEGTDFFYHVGTFGITVTERVKSLLESLDATNVQFKKCSEFIWP